MARSLAPATVKATAGNRKGDRRKRLAADDDLRRVVQNILGRQFVVGQGNRQPGAAPDVDAQAGVEDARRRRAHPRRHQHALPDLAVRPDLRHRAPGALRKVHLLAGDRLFRGGGVGRAAGCGRQKDEHANGRADSCRPMPGFCGSHSSPPRLPATIARAGPGQNKFADHWTWRGVGGFKRSRPVGRRSRYRCAGRMG
jgi:hypothetical protein